MELAHESLAKEVGALTSTISRVELNQTHAEELNKLRFDAVTQSIVQVETKLDKYSTVMYGFIERIEKIITGEVETQQTKQGQQMVAEYKMWRAQTDARLEDMETLSTQVRFFARVALTFTGTSVLATACAIYVAFFK